MVDDGSHDATPNVARELAGRDPRVRLLRRTESGGRSAARNDGLAEAGGGLVLFLDAEDRLEPWALASLTRALADQPGLGAARGGWTRTAPDLGNLPAEHGPPAENLFEHLARRPVVAGHSCLVRCELVLDVGGFDTGLRSCEDWDLWQRIARTGARCGRIEDVVARCGPDQAFLSSDPRSMARDGLTVIDRGHQADPRVREPASAWAAGLDRAEIGQAQAEFISWVAGSALARGDDAGELLRGVEGPCCDLDPSTVVSSLADSMRMATAETGRDSNAVWSRAQAPTERFLAELEQRSGSRALASRTLRMLEPAVAAPFGRKGGVIGRSRGVLIDAAERIADVHTAADCERLAVAVAFEGADIGALVLPVCDGEVPAAVISDAIAASFFWPLVGRLFASTVYPTLDRASGGEVSRNGLPLGTVEDGDGDALHDAIGWHVFLQELWGTPNEPWDAFYADGSAAVGRRASAILKLRGRRVDWEVSRAPRTGNAAGRGPCLVVPAVGGHALGMIRAASSSHRALRALVTRTCGLELCISAVREAVIGRPSAAPGNLRDRLAAVAAAKGSSLEPWTSGSSPARPAAPVSGREPARRIVLARHAGGSIGASSSRRARLPYGSAAALLEAAEAAGEPVRRDDRQYVGATVTYAPDLLWEPATPLTLPTPEPADAGERRHAFEALFANRSDPWDYTTPYEQLKYEQTLALAGERAVSALEIACAEGHFTEQLAGRCESLLAVDISDIALRRAAERCRSHANVQFVRLDVVDDVLPGSYDLIVCSEVLYYVRDTEQLGAVADKLAAALRPGGRLVTAHAHLLVDDPEGPGFDWTTRFGGRVIAETLGARRGLRAVREIRTPLYRVSSFERADTAPTDAPVPVIDRVPHAELAPDAARHVHAAASAGTARSPTRGGQAATGRRSIPILMYHRIAPETGRWTVSLDRFEAQLAYMASVGYRSLTLDEWRWSAETRSALTSPSVILTFDDGYRDFADHAWPLLRRYGFAATVFLVTDLVGATNEWDRGYEPELPLLSWTEVAELHRAGVSFEAHSATHPHLLALSNTEVVNEVAGSRAELTRRLGAPPAAFAYPFGDLDGAVAHLVGACGFTYGLTVRPGPATFTSSLLELPRVEISGHDGLEQFIAKLAPGETNFVSRA